MGESGDSTTRDLFEREDELASIDDTVRALRGGQARLLLFEGPAGIGKSRLIAQTRERASGAGIRTVTARGSELEHDFSFGVVRQMFESAVLGSGGADLLHGAAGLCHPIFDAMPGRGDADGDASFSVLHGLYWLTLNVAGDEPLLLVVDDLHWCDRPSLRFLAYLTKRLDGSPVGLVASLRPAEPGVDVALMAEITTDPMVVSVHPSSLTIDAVAQIIGARLGAAPDPRFLAACHDATGGNPLLLSELVKALEAEAVTPDAQSIALVQELGPRAASRAVLLRLARLPAGCVDTARALAVLGDGADLETIVRLTDRDRDLVVVATSHLARAEIIRPDQPFGFVHPLIRAAIYTDIPPSERETAHERAARLLSESGGSADQVASQLLASPGRNNPWVVETLEAAARQALGRGAPESAAAYLTRALAEPPDPEHRPELLLNLGSVESKLQGQMALDHLRDAYESIVDPVGRARAAAALAPIYFFLGIGELGAAVAERAIAELPSGHDELRDELEAARLTVAIYDPASMATNAATFDRHRHAVFGDSVGSRLLAGITAYHWAMTGGPMEPCVRLARHALAGGVLAKARNGSVPHVAAQIVLVMADLDEGLDTTNEAYRAAHESGALFEISPGRLFRGFALLRRGELADALEDYRTAQRDLDAWGFVSVRLYPGSLLARALIERGDFAGAQDALRHAHPSDEPIAPILASTWYLDSLLRLLVASGRMAEAVELSIDCEERFGATVPNPAWIPWRSLRAEALHRLGRPDEAAELCRAELELAKAWGASGAQSRALRVLGTVLGPEGLDALHEAVAITDGTPARLALTKALAALGTGLRLARRPTEAREPLSRALELATRSEMAPLVEQLRTELQATGVRPRTDALSGVGALTASERRVAEAAAAGQSNKDIAQALYVTPKTIEVHLSNAYRKLGIRSRRELEGALAA